MRYFFIVSCLTLDFYQGTDFKNYIDILFVIFNINYKIIHIPSAIIWNRYNITNFA